MPIDTAPISGALALSDESTHIVLRVMWHGGPSSVRSKCIYRIDAGGAAGWIPSEEDADEAGKGEGGEHRGYSDRSSTS